MKVISEYIFLYRKTVLGIANCFLTDFEHGVEFLTFFIFHYVKKNRSKTLKTHQIDGFRSQGPSKNARGYRFHAYKWSNHNINIDF